jgi:hypothetical protein
MKEKPVTPLKETETVHRNASWGAIISITIILAMVIIGAFYAWGQRISEERNLQTQLQSN